MSLLSRVISSPLAGIVKLSQAIASSIINSVLAVRFKIAVNLAASVVAVLVPVTVGDVPVPPI
jgi:hypothetical protein